MAHSDMRRNYHGSTGPREGHIPHGLHRLSGHPPGPSQDAFRFRAPGFQTQRPPSLLDFPLPRFPHDSQKPNFQRGSRSGRGNRNTRYTGPRQAYHCDTDRERYNEGDGFSMADFYEIDARSATPEVPGSVKFDSVKNESNSDPRGRGQGRERGQCRGRGQGRRRGQGRGRGRGKRDGNESNLKANENSEARPSNRGSAGKRGRGRAKDDNRDNFVSARDRTESIGHSSVNSEDTKSEVSEVNERSFDDSVDFKMLFKEVVEKYNGEITLDTIENELGEYFPSTMDILNRLRNEKSLFKVFENKSNKFNSRIVVHQNGFRLCVDYASGKGCCKDSCMYLHLCWQFIMDWCNHRSCKYSHEIRSDHNREVMKKYNNASSLIHGLSDNDLKTIIRCVSLRTCECYNESECTEKDEGSCPYVHICADKLLQKCTDSKKCGKNHDIMNCKDTLVRYRLDSLKPGLLNRMILVTPSKPEKVQKAASDLRQSREKEGEEGSEEDKEMPTERDENEAEVQVSVSEGEAEEQRDIKDEDNDQKKAEYFFDVLLKEHGGALEIGTLPCLYSDLSMDKYKELFQSHEDSFIVLEHLFKDSGDLVQIYMRNCQMCYDYLSHGHCIAPHCPILHICRDFVSGFCPLEGACKLSHDLFDEHNHEILRQLNLLRYNRQQVLTILRCSTVQLCSKYVKDGKCDDYDARVCPCLHICERFLRGTCPDRDTTCKLEHSLFETRVATTLLKYFGFIPDIEYVRRIVLFPPSLAKKPELATEKPEEEKQFIRENDVFICEQNLRGECRRGRKCQSHHCAAPYLWQIEVNGKWQDCEQGERIEEAYSQPRTSLVTLSKGKESYTLYFEKMIAHYPHSEKIFVVRRLSTESYVKGEERQSYYTLWLWYWQDDNKTWMPYGLDNEPPLPDVIESCFLGRKKLSTMHFEIQGKGEFYIDFKKMAQIGCESKNERAVRRRPHYVSSEDVFNKTMAPAPELHCDVTGLPDNWLPMDTKSKNRNKFLKVELPKDHDEYAKVLRKFNKNVQNESKYEIQHIYRIQNPDLWRPFARKREELKQKLHSLDAVKEKQLFHGTTTETVKGICFQNFDPRLSGKNATRFGKGAYFARKATYSDNYTSSGRHRFMFLARILIGRSAMGDPSYKRPPPVDPSHPDGELCDSCVDDPGHPSIYIVFERDQCYPEYLISYQRLDISEEIPDVRPKIPQTSFHRSPSPTRMYTSSIPSTRVSLNSTALSTPSTRVSSLRTSLSTSSTRVSSLGTPLITSSTRVSSTSSAGYTPSTRVTSTSTQGYTSSTRMSSINHPLYTPSTRVNASSTPINSSSIRVSASSTPSPSENTQVSPFTQNTSNSAKDSKSKDKGCVLQ